MSIRNLDKGYVVAIKHTQADGAFSPPPSKTWLVIGGTVSHVTGTATVIAFRPKNLATAGSGWYMLFNVPAATASAILNLFGTATPTVDAAPHYQPLILTNKDEVAFYTGAGTAEITLVVLEMDV